MTLDKAAARATIPAAFVIVRVRSAEKNGLRLTRDRRTVQHPTDRRLETAHPPLRSSRPSRPRHGTAPQVAAVDPHLQVRQPRLLREIVRDQVVAVGHEHATLVDLVPLGSDVEDHVEDLASDLHGVEQGCRAGREVPAPAGEDRRPEPVPVELVDDDLDGEIGNVAMQDLPQRTKLRREVAVALESDGETGSARRRRAACTASFKSCSNCA